MFENSAFYLSLFSCLLIGFVIGLISNGISFFSRFSPFYFEKLRLENRVDSLQKEIDNFNDRERELFSLLERFYGKNGENKNIKIINISQAIDNMSDIYQYGMICAERITSCGSGLFAMMGDTSFFSKRNMKDITNEIVKSLDITKAQLAEIGSLREELKVREKQIGALIVQNGGISDNLYVLAEENAALRRALGPLSPASLEQIERVRRNPPKPENGGEIIEG